MLPSIASEFGIAKLPEIMFGKEGKAWAKIRCVAKDRVRDAMGQWADGEPLFIDVIVNSGAEHLVDSVTVGDSIIAIGKLVQRDYEKDGVKHSILQFRAESVGVSVKWGPAKTQRVLEASGISAVKEVLNATEAPF
jgi:single-strand DNA-binding protein